jgi:hypothetical protein
VPTSRYLWELGGIFSQTKKWSYGAQKLQGFHIERRRGGGFFWPAVGETRKPILVLGRVNDFLWAAKIILQLWNESNYNLLLTTAAAAAARENA